MDVSKIAGPGWRVMIDSDPEPVPAPDFAGDDMLDFVRGADIDFDGGAE